MIYSKPSRIPSVWWRCINGRQAFRWRTAAANRTAIGSVYRMEFTP